MLGLLIVLGAIMFALPWCPDFLWICYALAWAAQMFYFGYLFARWY